MQKSFTCDLTLAASISGTIFLILNAIYGHLVSLKVKMLATLFTILGIFIITTSFVEINTDHWQEQFFLITLFTVVIINSKYYIANHICIVSVNQILYCFSMFGHNVWRYIRCSRSLPITLYDCFGQWSSLGRYTVGARFHFSASVWLCSRCYCSDIFHHW